MKVDNAKIEIRPRTPWEAMDLGILLGRQHAGLLISSWLVAIIPLYLLLLPIFSDQPGWIFFFIWWLKPLFERIPLYILSTAIFGATPTLKQTLIYWLNSLKSYLIQDLILNRIGLSRSYNLPVKQLERATGQTLRERVKLLNSSRNHSGWLTIVFLHIESFLTIGIVVLIAFMIPDGTMITNVSESNSFLDNDFGITHLTLIIYIAVLAITESLYIACGFCLYLNRRIILEGWDIELAFRRLSHRLLKATPLMILIIGISLTTFPHSVKAELIANENNSNSIVITAMDQAKINPLRQENKKSIKEILDTPPFYEEKEVTHYRFKSDKKKKEKKEKKTSEPNIQSSTNLMVVAQFIQVLVWAFVIFIIGFLLWKALEFLPILKTGRIKKSIPIPKEFQGLSITPESLPNDILAEFDKLWQQNPREALSLLYRALLSHLVHQYRIPLHKSHTEQEVVTLTKKLKNSSLTQFTQKVTRHWQSLAYGHIELTLESKNDLITDWKRFISQQDKGSL